jgi:hypothetical protein
MLALVIRLIRIRAMVAIVNQVWKFIRAKRMERGGR